MDWDQRVKQFLKWFGHEFLEVDGGYIFYKDESGQVWNSTETAFTKKMNIWNMSKNEKKPNSKE